MSVFARLLHLSKFRNEFKKLAHNHVNNLVRGLTTRIDKSTLDALCRVLRCQLGDLLEYVADEKEVEEG